MAFHFLFAEMECVMTSFMVGKPFEMVVDRPRQALLDFRIGTQKSSLVGNAVGTALDLVIVTALKGSKMRSDTQYLGGAGYLYKYKDETGVYKNLLQEIAQRVGAPLPQYTTFRSGLGHQPVFTCEVELAGITFTGEPAKNKKQAEKNAAMAAWSSLKQCESLPKVVAQQAANSSLDTENNDEQEQITIARALLNFRLKAKLANPANAPFPIKFPMQDHKSSTTPAATGSKILPLIRLKTTPRNRPTSAMNDGPLPPLSSTPFLQPENRGARPQQKFPAAGAAPYVPVRHYRPYHGIAPPVTIRTAVPVYSAPPLQPPPGRSPQMMAPAMSIAPPVHVRPAVPVFAASLPSVKIEEAPIFVGPAPLNKQSVLKEEQPTLVCHPPLSKSAVLKEEQPVLASHPRNKKGVQIEELSGLVLSPPQIKQTVEVEDVNVVAAPPAPDRPLVDTSEVRAAAAANDQQEFTAAESLKQLKI
ncbi:dsRNA-binding protein 2 [Asimina triloba]